MFTNRLLVASKIVNKPPNTDLDFIWTASDMALQVGYQHRFNHSDAAIGLVATNVYDPSKYTEKQPPHLLFPGAVPDVLDANLPESVRLDVLPALTAGNVCMEVETHPVIAHPLKENEELVISLEAQFMVLLPMEENKFMSIQPLFRWRPYIGSYEGLVAKFLRDDQGDTFIEVFWYKDDLTYESSRLPFDQFMLNAPRMVFRFVIKQGEVEFYVNGDLVGTMPYTATEQGEGELSIIYPEPNEQGANIAEMHLVRVHRKTVV